jgi:predicted secreted protein
MPSNAISGVGTLFRRWSGTAWVNIAEVNSIDGPNKTRNTIDVTSLDSTDGYKEFIAGFKDGGTVNLTMNFSRSTYDLMNTDYEADNTSFEFTALVVELGLSIPTDDKITSPVSLKISGPVVTESGSGS